MKQIVRLAPAVWLMMTGLLPAGAQNYTSPRQKWDFYLSISKNSCPEAYTILSGIPEWERYVKYAGKAATRQALVEQYNTVVHESCHHYNHLLADGKDADDGLFLDAQTRFVFRFAPTFPSRELNRSVPAKLQKDIFRYETYIAPVSLNSTQLSGIYGLVDEFNAYYHGTLATYQLYDWFVKEYGFRETENWMTGYVQETGTTMAACDEFRLFIAWYLGYAKKTHPDMYKGFLQDTTLRRAFTETEKRFLDLSGKWRSRLEQIRDSFTSAGIRTEIDDEYFQVYRGSSSQGHSHNLKEISWLRGLLTEEWEAELKKFRYP